MPLLPASSYKHHLTERGCHNPLLGPSWQQIAEMEFEPRAVELESLGI